jgi:hypothetical protein
MLGIRFVKTPPTTYLLQYRGGKVVREGAGLTFFHYAPASTLVAVPVASRDQGFIFEQATADFQTVTVQGQVAYRVADPARLATMLNYALRADGRGYESEDPEKLAQRVAAAVEVLSKQFVKDLALRDALRSGDAMAVHVTRELERHPEMRSLGLEVLGVTILAVKAAPDTARALEAEAREAILKAADDAVYLRRNAAVANERAIRESELKTDALVQEKKRELRDHDMQAAVALEAKRSEFVERNAANTRTLAEAEAHRLRAAMDALRGADPRVVQALAAAGMQPQQLIAQAFGGIAEKAERIGQLNVSPELLQSLLAAPPAPVPAKRP